MLHGISIHSEIQNPRAMEFGSKRAFGEKEKVTYMIQ